ncbi:hypothetical protein CEXT_261711 [Caerostris extrusa]|uniref:Uncharacterized protein n=1 Tax=Caerostris extrusa TaxID=172846 RepID=A0AAV4PGK7_CAEEX|nr:hypothetical protein CEXT_261711 [Caerostris extrusa]
MESYCFEKLRWEKTDAGISPSSHYPHHSPFKYATLTSPHNYFPLHWKVVGDIRSLTQRNVCSTSCDIKLAYFKNYVAVT